MSHEVGVDPVDDAGIDISQLWPTSRGHAHHPDFCASFCASKVILSGLAPKKRPAWTAQMPVLD